MSTQKLGASLVNLPQGTEQGYSSPGIQFEGLQTPPILS